MIVATGRQRVLLWSFIGSISLCAVTGIIGLLLDTWGPLQERILGTTAAIAAASVVALVCTIPWQRGLWQPIGPAGCLVVAAALTLLLLDIWTDFAKYAWMRNAVPISIVLSIAFGIACALSLARLRANYEWARMAAVGLLTTYTGMIIYVILYNPGYSWWNRTMGIIGILAALGLVATPILHRLSGLRKEDLPEGVAGEVGITCPRCGAQLKLPLGQSTCPNCQLGIRVEVK